MYAVITENDISKWADETGLKYHFPKRYLNILNPGTKIIYYKGRLREKEFANDRLSKDPHYFGIGEIGSVTAELHRTNYFADIKNFLLFNKAVLFKENNKTLEPIPPNRATNYFRDGVRQINKSIYDRICENILAETENFALNDNEEPGKALITVVFDGKEKKIYTTRYERNRSLRDLVIKLKGYTCEACEVNFRQKYGDWGEGFIHVHHKIPVSESKGSVGVYPQTDFDVVCPNCHSMIHRKKYSILSLIDLKTMLIKPN